METRSCALRAATEADMDAIVEIWLASAGLPGVGPVPMPTKADLLERASIEFANGWDVILVFCGPDILGFVAMKPQHAVLAELFVCPDSTGGGIGRVLLSHAKTAMPNGFTLYTRATNDGARRFYEREGLVKLRSGSHPRTGDSIVFYGWETAPSLASQSKE